MPARPLPFLTVTLAALALLVQGCLTAPVVETASVHAVVPEAVEAARPLLVQDHDHADAALHPPALAGARLVGHAAGTGDPKADGSYGELAVRGDRAYLERKGAEGGFIVFDVSDPAAPTVLGDWVGQPGGDIEVDAENRFAFLATQRNGLYGYGWNLEPEEPQGILPRGVHVVNVEDPADPRSESFFPLPPNGPHTITYYTDDTLGRELLIMCTYDIVFTTYPDDAGQNKVTQRVVITEVVDDPLTGKRTLEPIAQFQRMDRESADGELYFPHDVTVSRHPVTGQLLAYVAYWDLGMVILDITDPADPVELSTFNDFAPSGLAMLHQVRQFPEPINGKVVAVTEPEVPTADQTGQFTLVDVTDPTAPVRLGHWALPGDLLVNEPFLFSPHNFDLDREGRIVLSHNHAGLWVLDTACEGCLEAPREVAFFFPDVATLRPDHGGRAGFGTAFWDTREPGRFFAPEYGTGLFVLALE